MSLSFPQMNPEGSGFHTHAIRFSAIQISPREITFAFRFELECELILYLF